jgi:microcystin-dependent protein
MAYDGSTWDTASPTNATIANEIDDVARDMKIGMVGRLNQEHIWLGGQVATAEAGMHRYISLQSQAAPPALVTGTNTAQGAVYSTLGALTYINSASTVVPIVGSGWRSPFPPGTIMAYGGTAAPNTAYYLCNGAACSTSTDGALFAVVAFSYGGAGAVFNLPDLRGRAIVMQSAAGIFANMAASTGALTHQLTIAEMPNHTHSFTVEEGGANGALVRSNENAADAGTFVTGATGGDGAHNNVQPVLVCNYLIAR